MQRDQDRDWLRKGDADDKLPWLEPAGDYEDEPSGVKGKLIAGLIAAVALIALIFGGMSWYSNRDVTGGGSAEAELIKAPSQPYKVLPTNPGGMVVEGQGDTIYAAGAGNDPGGAIDLSALPEEPVTRTGPAVDTTEIATANLPPSTAARPGVPVPQARPVPQPQKPAVAARPVQNTTTLPVKTATAPLPKPAAPAARPAVAPAPVATGNGTYGLQLGAFSTRAKAESAWKSLSGRFAFVGALNKSVEPVAKGAATLYRLRASGIGSRASADNLCARLKVSGDSCTVVGP